MGNERLLERRWKEREPMGNKGAERGGKGMDEGGGGGKDGKGSQGTKGC